MNRIEYINAVKSALEVRKDERKEIEKWIAISAEALYHHYKFGIHAIHDATQRVLLRELHMDFPVTVLSVHDNAFNGCPTGEIPEILLVRILCIVLVCGDELMVEVHVNIGFQPL